MKPGMGKQKGAKFERDVCKQLSLWLSDGKQDDLLWRSSMSGGRATLGIKLGNYHRKQQAGDISPISVLGSHLLERFYIECKFYRDLQLANLIVDKPSKLVTFFEETKEQAAKYKKQPWLIAKQNRMPVLLVTQYMFTGEIWFQAPVNIFKEKIGIWLLDEFLAKVEPHALFGDIKIEGEED